MEYSTSPVVNIAGLIYIIVASYWDFRYKKIPNKLNFPVILAGPVINACYFGIEGLKLSIYGFFLAVALLLIPFALGGVGAGDVKLLAGIGSLKGPKFAVWVFLIFSLLYFLVSVSYLLFRGKLYRIVKDMIVSVYTRTPLTGTIYDKTGSVSFPVGIIISLACVVTEIIFRKSIT